MFSLVRGWSQSSLNARSIDYSFHEKFVEAGSVIQCGTFIKIFFEKVALNGR